ncbi:hypothetical protein [Sutterella sp.]|uniref:hypothetical protein n=1 Tax=Sutterella sp. TaxID=1981025 RepID=UPI0026E10926|nr:hypothetical protein [Sutterella sp.]MDO5532299.1 hypothetical protein [Sutterella sp.]
MTQEWQRTNALRSDLARRQALLEIDVLTAQAIGLTLDELLTLYRLRFRVMRDYDQNTWYDQKGRIVFTTNRGLVGVGLPRKAVPKDWEAGIRYAVDDKPCDYKGLGFDTVREKKSGQVTKTFPDDTMSETPQMTTVSYEAPFFRMDREADYRRAWAAFEERFREDKDEAPTEPAAVETSEKNDEEKN